MGICERGGGEMMWSEIQTAHVDVADAFAKRVLPGLRFLTSAGDGDYGAMVAALSNGRRLEPGWCDSQKGHTEVYFAMPDGSHGWLHTLCGRMTQSG